jgi:hypothetical protein
MKNINIKISLVLLLIIGAIAEEPIKLRGLCGSKSECSKDKHLECKLKAPPGPQGPKGRIGCPGEHGFDGATGAVGVPGEIGPVGPVGATGEPGVIGDVGPTGPGGNPGPAGIPGPPAAEGESGETGPTGPQGPIGETGEVGGQGRSCVCSRPVVYTRNLAGKFKFKNANKNSFVNVNSALDINISGPGLVIAWANGGYHLTDKCSAAFELDFVYEDSSKAIQFFTGTNAGAIGNHPGSSYTSAKDCNLYIPVGFSQGAILAPGNYIIHLYGRGNTDTIFKDLGVQVVFFPDCLVAL